MKKLDCDKYWNVNRNIKQFKLINLFVLLCPFKARSCIFTAVADFSTYLPLNGCTTGGPYFCGFVLLIWRKTAINLNEHLKRFAAWSEFLFDQLSKSELHTLRVSLPWEPPQTLSTQCQNQPKTSRFVKPLLQMKMEGGRTGNADETNVTDQYKLAECLGESMIWCGFPACWVWTSSKTGCKERATSWFLGMRAVSADPNWWSMLIQKS